MNDMEKADWERKKSATASVNKSNPKTEADI
jgi:hypothetical protein